LAGGQTGGEQRKLLKDVAPTVVDSGRLEGLDDPERGEDGVDEGEQHCSGTGETARENGDASEQFAGSDSAGKPGATLEAVRNALPVHGEVLPNEAKDAEDYGGSSVCGETELWQ